MAAAPTGYNAQNVAHSMANAEYNPAISSLKQALIDLATQGQYDQKQIKGYYGQMTGLDNSQLAAQQGNTQAAEANVTGDLGNVAQLFGGQNAQQMQPAVGNAVGLIGAEGKSEQDYLSNMLPLLQAQGAQGASQIDQMTQAQQKNYNDQLTQQQQAKGQAYNADYQQALSDKTTQEQNQLALQQAQQMFPAQLSAAKSTAKADRVNANSAGAYNQARINAQNASAAHSNALSSEVQSEIQKNMAEARKESIAATAAGVKAKQGPLSPGSTSFERIQAGLYKSMSSGSGKSGIANPIRAQHALYSQAVSAGLVDKKGNPLVPGAIKLLNATLSEMYNRDSAWQKGFQWTGRRFVPRKK